MPDGDTTPSAFSPNSGDVPKDEWRSDLQDDTKITVNRSVNTYLISHRNTKVPLSVLIQ